MKKRLPIIFSCVLISSCISPFGTQQPSETVYVLGDQITFPKESSAPKNTNVKKVPLRLWITEAESSPLIDSRKILFSREASSRGKYQFAAWAEAPPARFTELLGQAYTNSQAFKSVFVGKELVQADIVLNTQILEFYHDAAVQPPVVRVHILVIILNLKSQNMIAKNSFEKNLAIEENNSKGAVQGFDRAVEEIISEIITWTTLQSLR